ncbi:MAG TPA: phytanoyl-CoA dioxygenase family protein [Alphaproteobacteria bacterium]|nr:phytanoyl-CoA dioxygenase family protein [Alphaproteobacteria bacterium]
MLSQPQIEQYREEGYVVVRDVLTPEQVRTMRAEIDRIVAGAVSVERSDDVFDLEDSHTPANPRLRRIKAPHKVASYFWDLVRSPAIVDLLKPLLGPNIRLQNSKLNLKSAGYGAPVEWHQDWAYYPYTNDDVLAVGVMIDDFVEDNGPMMVLPGTHRGPTYDHHAAGRFCGGIDPVASGIDFSKAVKLLAPAGSVSVHHARLIHGSDLNRSGKSRRFLLYEIMAADAWPLAGSFAPFSTLEEFNARMIAGEPSIEPRLEKVPVRMPLPKPLDPSSLYQAQKGLGTRYFEQLKEPVLTGR